MILRVSRHRRQCYVVKAQDFLGPVETLIVDCSFLPRVFAKVVTILCSDGLQFWKLHLIYIFNQADPQW